MTDTIIESETPVNWGPSGKTVFDRTYSRPKHDGTHETWPETCRRTARGNLELVYGPMGSWPANVMREYLELVERMIRFEILPAGRHLWASGIKGRQFLMNCWTAGWTEDLSHHFEFTFLRLMEGGGVGANYSSHFLKQYGLPRRELDVHIVCDPDHADYPAMLEAGVLSEDYCSDWEGSFLVDDSREGWADALTDLIETFMTDCDVKHRARVFDVSNVRPEGARLKTFGGTASGPRPFATMMIEVARVLARAAIRRPDPTWRSLALEYVDGDQRRAMYAPAVAVDQNGEGDFRFAMQTLGHQHITPLEAMEMDHAIAECVVSGGVRRSARMSMIRWDDPFVEDFISCKADTGSHWTTNISVEIDDEFIDLLDGDETRIMTLAGETVRRIGNQAQHVHRLVVEAMLENGEPGYWNSTLSNMGELTPVFATNPCGEIALNEHEPCVLAHVNLDAFAPTGKGGSPNEGGLLRAHELATRFALRATFGDVMSPLSRDIIAKNRRIGVGHLGVQGFLVKNGYKYSDVASNTRSPGYHWFRDLLSRLGWAVDNAADLYAFDLRIPAPIKTKAIAPTGSISKLPGVSEGIQTVYARFFEQRIRYSKVDPRQMAQVEEARQAGYAVEQDVYDSSGNTLVVVYPTKHMLVEQVEALGLDADLVEQADELAVDQALAFQAMYQRHYLGARGNAVSFTVNVPEGLRADVTSDIIKAWLPALKGTTVMVDGTRPQSPYTRISREQYERVSLNAVVGDGIDEECATGACPIR